MFSGRPSGKAQRTPVAVQLTLAYQPCLVCTAMTLPLSNSFAIVGRPPRDIQALATVASDESISGADRLYAPLLVRAAVTLPLDDRRGR